MLEKIIIIYFYGDFFGQILEKNKNSIIKEEANYIHPDYYYTITVSI